MPALLRKFKNGLTYSVYFRRLRNIHPLAYLRFAAGYD